MMNTKMQTLISKDLQIALLKNVLKSTNQRQRWAISFLS